MDDAVNLRELLSNARVGDCLRVRFKSGKGKKGVLTPDEQVALFRFLALSEWNTPQPRLQVCKTDAVPRSLGLGLLMFVAQSGYWDQVPKEYMLVVQRAIDEEAADFFGSRIGPALDELAIAPPA